MPGTRWPGWNATCSVSAKKLSGLRFSTRRPMRRTGTSSSGISLVGSSRSKAKRCSSASGTTCTPSSHSGNWPLAMASQRSRRWKSASWPASACASSQVSACTPSLGFQWNLTKLDAPCVFTKRKVCTPKPSIMRRLRGMPRSDITHISMCVVSGMSVTKSQKVSCALAA
ncbi:hypothetical protein Y695_04243 [Hydrogenophaga sp. T4]|nr:hypothetical protein Y695_04243 [Hydrogenophaga sp. T4]